MKKQKILDVLGTVKTGPRNEDFTAGKFFIRGKKDVDIWMMWYPFYAQFLIGAGKIEKPVGEATLCYGIRNGNPIGPSII